MPSVECVLPSLHAEPQTRQIVIASSKQLLDTKDFQVRDGGSKKVSLKDLVQALQEDPCHRQRPLLYRLSNSN